MAPSNRLSVRSRLFEWIGWAIVLALIAFFAAQVPDAMSAYRWRQSFSNALGIALLYLRMPESQRDTIHDGVPVILNGEVARCPYTQSRFVWDIPDGGISEVETCYVARSETANSEGRRFYAVVNLQHGDFTGYIGKESKFDPITHAMKFDSEPSSGSPNR